MAKQNSKEKVALVNPKNQLIQQLEGSDYIKNPLVYSQIRGDFSLLQTNVLVAIAATMQDRINSKFQGGRLGPLFTKEELSHGKITFEVPLNSLGVKTKEYASVHESCKALTKLDMTYTYTDVATGERRTKTSVIFTDVDVPTYTTSTGQQRRVGNIKIDMNASVAEQIFNTSSAYVEHLEGIVKLCRSPRTPRLYVYLSAWKQQRFCTFNYLALKEFLGIVTYSKDRQKILTDKCTTWAVFHRDVLDPAKPDSVRFMLYPSRVPVAALEDKEGEEVTNSSTNMSNLSPEEQMMWAMFCKSVKLHCGAEFYDVFVTPTSLRSCDEHWVKVNVPSRFVAEEWEKQGMPLFDTIREVFGSTVKLSYQIVK